MATVTALKQIHFTDKVHEAGETFEMDDKKAEFLIKRNAVTKELVLDEVKTKELKFDKAKTK